MARELRNTYKIIFNTSGSADDSTGEGTPTTPEQEGKPSTQNPTKDASKQGNIKKGAKIAGLAIAGSVVKSSISYGISNIGKFTGSSSAQEQANMIMKIAGYGAMVIANPIAGGVAIATDLIINAIDKAYDQKWERVELNQQRMRVGLSEIKSRR